MPPLPIKRLDLSFLPKAKERNMFWGDMLEEIPRTEEDDEVEAEMEEKDDPCCAAAKEKLVELSSATSEKTLNRLRELYAKIPCEEFRQFLESYPHLPDYAKQKSVLEEWDACASQSFSGDFTASEDALDSAFESAWGIVKAVLPDLPFNADLERMRGFNPYERDAITYQMGIDPDEARGILGSGYKRDEDAIMYPDQIQAWDRELKQNPTLFEFPQHILSRLSGRNSRDQRMDIEDFRNLALNPDSGTDESHMTRYIDEMENRGKPVIVGNAQISPSTQNMHTITVNPGFEGQGIGRHLLGAMLQEQGGVHDTQFSREGYELFRNMGNLLTQGGTQNMLPFLQSGSPDVSDFNQKYYHNKGLIESILDDVRFTQPYGTNLNDVSDSGASAYFDEGKMVYRPPSFYPIDFSAPSGDGVNPKAIGRNPFEITYTGDDPSFITNLGVD